jgi:hypothetical protein
VVVRVEALRVAVPVVVRVEALRVAVPVVVRVEALRVAVLRVADLLAVVPGRRGEGVRRSASRGVVLSRAVAERNFARSRRNPLPVRVFRSRLM